MEKPKVSVIIPVYGVEEYIEKCARSLMMQTLTDVEYIFIDDCTPDKSMAVLERVLRDYPQRAHGVVIEHNKRNLGQAKTRRKGVEMAQGDYIIHCDPDDWVESNWLQDLYNRALESGADIVWTGFESVHSDGKRIAFPNDAEETIEGFLLAISTGHKWGSLCMHLVKRQIAQSSSIDWPDWNYCEDLALIFQYVSMAKKVAFVEDTAYKYRHNTASITGRRDIEGVIANVNGEISALRQGLDISRKLGLNGRLIANLHKRIFRAKSRLSMVADSPQHFCRLWHAVNDGMGLRQLWTSSLPLREKVTYTSINLNIYPFLKR